jgi:hypothetical protein
MDSCTKKKKMEKEYSEKISSLFHAILYYTPLAKTLYLYYL